jgi:hypothetical protein
MNLPRPLLPLALFLALAVFEGCAAPAETGTLAFAVTDGPTDDYETVNVTFSRVAIHRSQGADANETAGWLTIVNTTRTVDLLALHRNDTAETLGFAELAAGTYQQLRFYVDQVEALGKDGQVVTMVVPSGALKTHGSFDVTAGGNTTVTLEIDLDKSIRCTPQGCKFLPHIGRVETSEG